VNNFVNQITADKWVGAVTDDAVIEFPTLQDLHRVIEALDANVKTSVFLAGGNGAYMAIGGGFGRYVVYISLRDKEFWNLYSGGTGANNVVSIVIGGQDGYYADRQVVDKNTAIKAAEYFFLNGEPDPAFHWERQ